MSEASSDNSDLPDNSAHNIAIERIAKVYGLSTTEAVAYYYHNGDAVIDTDKFIEWHVTSGENAPSKTSTDDSSSV